MEGKAKNITGKIIKISGPLVVAENVADVKMYDIVKVGDNELTGEVIQMCKKIVWIQVYENTTGLKIGEQVYTTGKPLSMKLGPGLLTSFYDGIQRPLREIAEQQGIFINSGAQTESLNLNTNWKFKATKKVGDKVVGGDVIGTVKETEIITHKIIVPVGLSGTLDQITSGTYKINEKIAVLKQEDGQSIDLFMYQEWAIRQARPKKKKIFSKEPLKTGQRVIDTFFPVTKGGSAISPGPFGSGKSVIQQQLAKWSDADIIVYVGCGERGNEMTDLLVEFPELNDPNTGRPLMEKCILIANTSNMPIAAREASIYTGVTLAEYYRDMGYDVAMMADSTSRWAEALREMSGRLEEMPGEESYPAYLNSRIAEFYERAGKVYCLGSEEKVGSVTLVGAVSPPGGDMSDPVVQSSLQFTKVFWELDASLANARHYPSINWLKSYSMYLEETDKYNEQNLDREFPILRKKAIRILQQEADLLEIIKIVGMEAVSAADQITLDTARSLREDYMQQNAFDEIDAYSSPTKQLYMLQAIMQYHFAATNIIKLAPETNLNLLLDNEIKNQISSFKFTLEDEKETIKKYLNKQVEKLVKFVNNHADEDNDYEVNLKDIINDLEI